MPQTVCAMCILELDPEETKAAMEDESSPLAWETFAIDNMLTPCLPEIH